MHIISSNAWNRNWCNCKEKEIYKHSLRFQNPCYRLFVSHAPNVEILIPNVMILGSGVFGRWIGLEVGGFLNRLVPISNRPQKALCPFCHGKTQQKDVHLWNREARSWHHICQHLDLRIPSLWDYEKQFVLFIGHKVYDILL